MNHFSTFQRFTDEDQAREFMELLESAGIAFQLENNSSIFDPNFTTNNLSQQEINVKVHPADFNRVHQLLADTYQQQLNEVAADYYLFDFTDEELREIISRPDEWGAFDYQFAQKLLKDRGSEIKPEEARAMKNQRIKELALPEPAHTYWLLAGYLFSFLGGFLGFLIGWNLTSAKKTLPDGNRVYVYPEPARRHGSRILVISTLCFAGWFWLRFGRDW